MSDCTSEVLDQVAEDEVEDAPVGVLLFGRSGIGAGAGWLLNGYIPPWTTAPGNRTSLMQRMPVKCMGRPLIINDSRAAKTDVCPKISTNSSVGKIESPGCVWVRSASVASMYHVP